MKFLLRTAKFCAIALIVAGCSTMPERNAAVEDARATYNAAQNNPQVVSFAPLELNQATEAFRRAESAWTNKEDSDVIAQLAYLAKQRAAIAIETGRLRAAEASIATATRERDRAQLDARTREAARAQASAAAAQRNAQAAQMSAEATRQQAEESRRQALLAQQQAATSQQQAQDAEARARALNAQLSDLQAKQTNRGMVITLGDVLFDTGKAQLKSGAMRSVQKLADFMRQYPERKVSIEGFTDSVGNESYNQDLSERRANAVRIALIDAGIAVDRILVRGYGESFPVASNDNAAGRQLNRRVEVVISDESGNIRSRS